MRKRLAILVGLASAIGLLYFVTRPSSVTNEAALALLARCLETRAENCSVEGSASWREIAGQRYRLVRSADPRFAVADYEFVSENGLFCAFVQFGKDDLRFVQTAQFYRCADRERVTLGIG